MWGPDPAERSGSVIQNVMSLQTWNHLQIMYILDWKLTIYLNICLIWSLVTLHPSIFIPHWKWTQIPAKLVTGYTIFQYFQIGKRPKYLIWKDHSFTLHLSLEMDCVMMSRLVMIIIIIVLSINNAKLDTSGWKS